MSDDNVKSLFGGPIVQREANTACVKILEEMLDAAKSGEVVGVALAAVYSDRGTTCRAGGVATYGLVGQLVRVQRDVLVDLDGD